MYKHLKSRRSLVFMTSWFCIKKCLILSKSTTHLRMSVGKTSKGREIITINVGGAGVGLGQSSLEQYCVEQGISTTGNKEANTKHEDSLSISFTETSKGKFIARSLFIDMDPYTIQCTKSLYPYSNVLNESYLINGKTSCSDIWARAHYVDGKEIIDQVSNTIRLSVEDCDSVDGFIFNHSLSGGTGGGLGALVLERLAVDYRKKCKFAFESFYDDNKSTTANLIYNTLLSMHWSMDYTEASIILDNKQMYCICRYKLGIKSPRYKHYNGLCAKLMSNITAPFRFGLSNDDMMSFSTDMTPFPRLHWLMTSMSPMLPKTTYKYKTDIRSLTDRCLRSENFFHRCSDFDCEEDKYLAMMFSYRGKDVGKDLVDTNACMKAFGLETWLGRKMAYVGWIATNRPSVKFIKSAPVALPSDDILIGDKQVLMVGNNTCIDRLFQERIAKKYDLMYSQRAYVHWYVGWGMEEGEFCEAREDLGFLAKDYLDVRSSVDDSEDEFDFSKE
eukprot:453142_1